MRTVGPRFVLHSRRAWSLRRTASLNSAKSRASDATERRSALDQFVIRSRHCDYVIILPDFATRLSFIAVILARGQRHQSSAVEFELQVDDILRVLSACFHRYSHAGAVERHICGDYRASGGWARWTLS